MRGVLEGRRHHGRRTAAVAVVGDRQAVEGVQEAPLDLAVVLRRYEARVQARSELLSLQERLLHLHAGGSGHAQQLMSGGPKGAERR